MKVIISIALLINVLSLNVFASDLPDYSNEDLIASEDQVAIVEALALEYRQIFGRQKYRLMCDNVYLYYPLIYGNQKYFNWYRLDGTNPLLVFYSKLEPGETEQRIHEWRVSTNPQMTEVISVVLVKYDGELIKYNHGTIVDPDFVEEFESEIHSTTICYQKKAEKWKKVR